jgi:predicted HTH transcriptional regulator
MRNAAREAQVAEPEFVLNDFFKVTFGRNAPDIPIDRQSTANRSQSVAATDRKKTVLSFLEENERAKIGELINLIGLSDGRVRALLREMVSDGTIEKVGTNRYTYYILKP